MNTVAAAMIAVGLGGLVALFGVDPASAAEAGRYVVGGRY